MNVLRIPRFGEIKTKQQRIWGSAVHFSGNCFYRDLSYLLKRGCATPRKLHLALLLVI